MTLVDQQDEKALSNRSPRRQNLDKKIGVIRQKKTSQQQVLFQFLNFFCHFRVFISATLVLVLFARHRFTRVQ